MLTLTLWLIAAPARPLDLDSLLIASVGGPEALERLKKVSSIYSTGKAEISNLEGTFQSWYRAPHYYRLHLDLGSFSVITGHDGRTTWQQDHNGQVSELTGLQKRKVLGQLYFESYSYLIEGRLPGEVVYMGDTIREDSGYHQVAFVLPEADTTRAFFCAHDGLRRHVLGWTDNLETNTRIGDYRSVEGVRLPFYSHATTPAVPLTAEITLDSVVFDRPVDTAFFSMPAIDRTGFRFDSPESTIVIPFTYWRGHIYVEVTVNGRHRALFMLDSGASSTLLHDPWAAGLDLPKGGSVPVRGLSGFGEVQLVRLDSLTIGAITLLDQVSGRIDLSAIVRQAPPGRQFGGSLGYDFLSRCPVLVNYADSTLTFFDPQGFQRPAGGVEIGFHTNWSVPTIRAEIDGVPGDFLVDLGNALGLMIHPEFARKYRLDTVLTDFADISQQVTGIGGTLGGRTALAQALSFGPIRIEALRVILPDATGGISGTTELAGNIGNLILEDFAVLFDYEQGRLVFYPDIR
jgi:hypothetical protein